MSSLASLASPSLALYKTIPYALRRSSRVRLSLYLYLFPISRGTTMATAINISAAVAAILLFSYVGKASATVYTVGDTAGWAMGADYSTWTTGKTFAVGDSLVFNYPGGHTVDEVKESDYSGCTTGNSISSDSSGATTIQLKSAGKRYFICAVPGHCSGGMKLAVTVAAASAASPSATPTTPTTTPSTTPAGTTPATSVPTTHGTTSIPSAATPSSSISLAILLTASALLF
ncbi:hypothetical protein ACLOJK_013487 [Asimina triloba]